MKVVDGDKVLQDTEDHREIELADPPSEVEQARVAVELEAARLYVEFGTLSEVSRILGVSLQQLAKFARSVWWQDEVALLRREKSVLELAKQTKILHMSLDMLMDRLEHGDVIMGKGGVRRIPLKATDIARIAHTVFTERQLIMHEPTQIAGDTGKVRVLADKLRALGAKDITIIDEEGNATEAS